VLLHGRPLAGYPEIVQYPESTTLEVFAQDRSVLHGEHHLLGLAGINQRVLEQRWIVDWNGAFVVGDVEIREPLDAQDQLMVCLWVIRVPILVVTRDAAVVDQPDRKSTRLNSSHEW